MGTERPGVLAVAGAALLLAACSRYRTPVAEVGRVVLGERGDEAIAARVELSVLNENDEALPVYAVEYQVDVDGALYDGLWWPGVSLQAGGTTIVPLPAVLPLEAASGEGLYTVRGRLRYQKPGEFQRTLHVAGVPRPSVRVTGSGRIADH
jgi:hypothetical protein